MTYKPEDYQVVDERNYSDGGKAFDVLIKGANFTIYCEMNKFQPTNIFKFNQKIGLILNENTIVGTVEIDWDTCFAGMQHLAKQMGLKCIPGIVGVTTLGRQTYFIEEVET